MLSKSGCKGHFADADKSFHLQRWSRETVAWTGQARDVLIFHFVSEKAGDLKFLHYLIGKADQIKEGLGAAGDPFDEATHRRLIRGESLEKMQNELELQIDRIKGQVSIAAGSTIFFEAGQEKQDSMAALDRLVKK